MKIPFCALIAPKAHFQFGVGCKQATEVCGVATRFNRSGKTHTVAIGEATDYWGNPEADSGQCRNMSLQLDTTVEYYMPLYVIWCDP